MLNTPDGLAYLATAQQPRTSAPYEGRDDADPSDAKNCDGRSMSTRGSSGYDPKLDADGDGRSCEPGWDDYDPPTTTSPPPRSQPAASAYYASCADARAAGAAPMYRGDPGYRAGLDRDSDGIACDP